MTQKTTAELIEWLDDIEKASTACHELRPDDGDMAESVRDRLLAAEKMAESLNDVIRGTTAVLLDCELSEPKGIIYPAVLLTIYQDIKQALAEWEESMTISSDTMKEAERLADETPAYFENMARFIRKIQTEAYEAGRASAVPDGWQVVPKDPSRLMLATGEGACNEFRNIRQVEAVWKAMLATAPQPKEE